MKQWLMSVTLLMWSVVLATADEPTPEPKGQAPKFLIAQVGGKEGDQLTLMDYVFELQQVEKDGKRSTKQVAVLKPILTMPIAIGKDVRAYGTDGKPLENSELQKRLAKPTPVVVFLSVDPPDPYYLRLFREGTVVLGVARDTFYPPPPKGIPIQPKK